MQVYDAPDQLEADARAAGLTMTRLCETAGVHYTTWYRWRTGTHRAGYLVREALSRALEKAREENGSES